MDVVDAEVLAALRHDVCRPVIVEEAVDLVLAELALARQDEARDRLGAELEATHLECARLAEAIRRGGPWRPC
jgi:hypothetical protein